MIFPIYTSRRGALGETAWFDLSILLDWQAGGEEKVGRSIM
jgi:hypothetical protein